MVKSSDDVGVAFVGAGSVTQSGHSQAVRRCEGAALVGVFDPEVETAEQVAQEHGARTYGSLDELLADDAVHAVVVAAPTAHQFDSTVACLRAGKHVLIEKPVCERVEEIDELIALAEERGLVAMPAHNFIYQATLAKGREMARSGQLGTIGSAWVVFNLFHSEETASRYVGVMRQMGWHLVYSLLYLLGRPKRVMAASTCLHYEELTREDQVMLVCEMPDGALANLWASFVGNDPTSDPWTMIWKVLGTHGGFTYSWNEAVFQDPAGAAWGVPALLDGFAGEVDAFVREVRGEGPASISTIGDARDTMRVLEAAERSIAHDGAFQEVDYS